MKCAQNAAYNTKLKKDWIIKATLGVALKQIKGPDDMDEGVWLPP